MSQETATDQNIAFGPPSTSDQESCWIGHVDRYDSNGVYGWAADVRAPNSAIRVEMVDVKGRRLAHIIADTYRHDLGDAGFGNGRHGYFLPFTDRSRSASIVYIRFSDSKVLLNGGIIDIQVENFLYSSPMPDRFFVLMNDAAFEVQQAEEDARAAL